MHISTKAMALAGVALSLACGGGGGGSKVSSPTPSIAAFAPDKSAILYGESAHLSATFANGTGTIDRGVGAITSGQAVPVAPTQDTTYTLTVSGGGQVATRTCAVAVSQPTLDQVSPAATSVLPGGQVTFSATVSGALDTAIVWSASGGTMDPALGNWTAPATPGTYTITAKSHALASVSVTATAVVSAVPTIESFTLAAPVLYGGQASMTPVFSGGAGAIDGTPVVSGQVYSVGPIREARSCTLTVGTGPEAASASLQVVPQTPTISALTVPAPYLASGASFQLGGGMVSGAADASVAWACSGGNVSATGLYTAPSAPGDYVVTAASVAYPAASTSTSVHVAVVPAIAGIDTPGTQALYGEIVTITPRFSGGTGLITPGDIAVADGVPTSIKATTAPYLLTVRSADPLVAPVSSAFSVNTSTVYLEDRTLIHAGAPGQVVSLSFLSIGGSTNGVALTTSAGTVSHVAQANSVTTARLTLPLDGGATTITVTATSLDDASVSIASTVRTLVAGASAAPTFTISTGFARYPYYASVRTGDSWGELDLYVEGLGTQPLAVGLLVPGSTTPVATTITGGVEAPVSSSAYTSSVDGYGNRIWRTSPSLTPTLTGGEIVATTTTTAGKEIVQKMRLVQGSRPRLLGLDESPTGFRRLPGEALTTTVDLGTFPGYSGFALASGGGTGVLGIGEPLTHGQTLSLRDDDFTVDQADAQAAPTTSRYAVAAIHASNPSGIFVPSGAITYKVYTDWWRPAGLPWSPSGNAIIGGRPIPVGDGAVVLYGAREYLPENGSTIALPKLGKWSSANERWTTLCTLPWVPDEGDAVSLVGDGLYRFGGLDGAGAASAAVVRIDVESGVVTSVGSLTEPRGSGAIAQALPDGRVLVLGGTGTGSCEVFNPADGTSSGVASAPYAVSVGAKAAMIPDGRVVVVGSDQPHALLYSPQADTWESSAIESARHHGHTVSVVRSGRIVVAGGVGPDDIVLGNAEIFDPVARTWTSTPLPLLEVSAGLTGHSAVELPDGRVLLTGGCVDSASTLPALYSVVVDPTRNSAHRRRGLHVGAYNGQLAPIGACLLDGSPVVFPAAFGQGTGSSVGVVAVKVAF